MLKIKVFRVPSLPIPTAPSTPQKFQLKGKQKEQQVDPTWGMLPPHRFAAGLLWTEAYGDSCEDQEPQSRTRHRQRVLSTNTPGLLGGPTGSGSCQMQVETAWTPTQGPPGEELPRTMASAAPQGFETRERTAQGFLMPPSSLTSSRAACGHRQLPKSQTITSGPFGSKLLNAL